MRKRILRRLPSPAMVVACLALTVALGGTSYAAIKLPRNSVGNAQMRNNAVGVKELQKNAVVATKLSKRSVGPQKLQNNAVTTRTVKKDQLTGDKIVESTLQKVPSASAADTAANANTVGGYTPRRFSTSVAPNGAAETVLSLNGLVITLSCPGGAVALRANNASGEAAQLRFDGVDDATAVFEGGSANFVGTTNADLNNSVNRGSGAAYYVRANGTGVTALYGWREDALGGSSACRVFGQAVGG
jgi:hypothetical protein